MTFLAVVQVANNRIAKYAAFQTIEEAEAHVQEFGGFVHAGDYSPDLWVEGATVSVSPHPAPAPSSVHMRQARLALLQAGLLPQVQAAVAAAGEAAQIEWEYAHEVRRDSPLVQSLSASLALSDAQLDGLFILASSL